MNMKKILVYLYNDMAYWEISILIQLLTYDFKDKIELISISDKNDSIIYSSNMIFQPEKILEDVNDIRDIEGLIIPGGYYRKHNELIYETIRKLNKNNKVIGAICGAPIILAEANILDSRKFTTSYNEDYFIKNKLHNPFGFTNYRDEGVVIDKNIITAKPNFFIEFAIEYCSILNLFDSRKSKISTLNWYKVKN